MAIAPKIPRGPPAAFKTALIALGIILATSAIVCDIVEPVFLFWDIVSEFSAPTLAIIPKVSKCFSVVLMVVIRFAASEILLPTSFTLFRLSLSPAKLTIASPTPFIEETCSLRRSLWILFVLISFLFISFWISISFKAFPSCKEALSNK